MTITRLVAYKEYLEIGERMPVSRSKVARYQVNFTKNFLIMFCRTRGDEGREMTHLTDTGATVRRQKTMSSTLLVPKIHGWIYLYRFDVTAI
jgi:hypothetical protein